MLCVKYKHEHHMPIPVLNCGCLTYSCSLSALVEHVLLFIVNSFTNYKILHLSKLKAFTDNTCSSNDNSCLSTVRKHCGKWRKCWLPAFSPFPTIFPKCLFLKVVKSQDCMVKCFLFNLN